MTRKEALTDLLVKVESGGFDAQPGGEFRPRFNAFMNLAEVAFGFYGPVGLPELAWRAYNHESLDAAKALHEAVLPGWVITVERINSGRWIVILRLEPSVGTVDADNEDPARAWLIAIIKALIAKEDT